jgi:hypothetical protein
MQMIADGRSKKMEKGCVRAEIQIVFTTVRSGVLNNSHPSVNNSPSLSLTLMKADKPSFPNLERQKNNRATLKYNKVYLNNISLNIPAEFPTRKRIVRSFLEHNK